MTDQPIKSIVYAADRLRTKVVRTFGHLAGFADSPEGLEKARRCLSRCLSRALYEPTSEEIRQGRNVETAWERWSFEYRRQLYHVSVRGSEALAVMRVVKGPKS